MLDTNILDIDIKSAVGLLTLSSIKGIGRSAINKVAERFLTIGECLDAPDEALKGCLNTSQRASIRDASVLGKAYSSALKESELAERMGVTVITLHDVAYPERLRELDEPPLILNVIGDLSIVKAGIAFVGTREPTDFGSVVAHRMATAAAEDGWCIVSGLARGVDSICHSAALQAHGTTVAVLASGIDTYSSNAAMNLAKRICDHGGAVAMEQRLGFEATRGTYIDRDRLITGLSLATFFIQGDLHSGSMHSVRYSTVQGKPVYVPAIPAAYASEDKNDTARNLATMTKRDFASLAGWSSKVMEAIDDDPHGNMAEVIRGRDDYARVFSDIRGLLRDGAVVGSRFYEDIAATF